ncbi:MAG: GatB/YqeY domain-containing protein [bacterium]
MSLQEQIQREMQEAMKAKDSLRLAVLRMMKTALKNKEIEKREPLEESEEMAVVRTLVKQRRDSIEQFRKGDREELAQKEEAELKLVEAYLPPAVDESKIDEAVAAAVQETGATSPKEMGKVMKAVMAKFAGQTVDGKLVSGKVRAHLQSGD